MYSFAHKTRNYCASTDEETIHEGLEFVRETLAAKYVKPDEREVVKSAINRSAP